MSVERSPQVESALAEVQRYLQNEIPPEATAGTVALLMAQPPDLVMHFVGTWATEQARRHQARVLDLLLHALKKIYVMGELNLLDREAIATYLDRVTGPALRYCADENERTDLRNRLTRMRMSKTTMTGSVPIAIPPPPPPPPPAPIVTSDEDAQAARRLSLILERLGTAARASNGQPAAATDAQAVAQMLTMAATTSKSDQQFNEYLQQIQPLAGAAGGNVFVILGGAMPSWDIPQVPGGAQKPPAQIGAMERIIDLADPAQTMDRFRELVLAAVDKFNDGSLAPTLWMLDVAQDAITEKKLDPAAVHRIYTEATEKINAAQLRKYVENKRQHAALRIILDCFSTLAPTVLFQQLRGEPRAEKRRWLLGFLEAHLERARATALTELEGELMRLDVDTYYLRNMIYLLHRIPHEGIEGDDRELAALERASVVGQNIYVVKEAATALGRTKTDAVAALLIQRLGEFEEAAIKGAASYPPAEVQKLLDRIAGSLARMGTPAALVAVAQHGLKSQVQLGDTRARLAGLSQHDLAFNDTAEEVLRKALRSEIPGKFLGRLITKKQEPIVQLIDALSGTRSDGVKELFREIVERFAEEPIGRAAAQALDLRAPAAKTTTKAEAGGATLTGELEFFGLPSVMQSLAEMRATGMVTLSTKQGQAVAGLAFIEGKFINAQRGPLRGIDALYEILERPIAGKFAFVPHPIERMKTTIQPQDIIGLMLEGVRRHDELQQLLALIPDDLKLAKGTVKPTPHAEEDDPALVREIWLKASSNAAVGEWGKGIPTDSYRVRRLVAHWLETGALTQMNA